MSALPKILIAGSGPGALEAALSLGSGEYFECEITLISPQLEFAYRPNLVMQPFGVKPPALYRVADVIGGLPVTQYQGTIERVEAQNKHAYSPEGDVFEFDAMIVATGTSPEAGLPDPTVTVTAPRSTEKLAELIAGIDSSQIDRVIFTAADAGHTWQLPMYEIALMAADRGSRNRNQQPVIMVASPEREPLEVFGPAHSRGVRALADELGVDLLLEDHVTAFDGRSAATLGGERLECDAVVALPKLRGRVPQGLPSNDNGFIPVDRHQRVADVDGLYAIGDVTDFAVKQGGLASAQADAAVRAIAASFGELDDPAPFDPVIEATLMTASHRVELRARIGPDGSESLPAEPTDAPSKKIHSRLLSARLDAISAIN